MTRCLSSYSVDFNTIACRKQNDFVEVAEAFQDKRKIDNRGLFHRELLAEFHRRGFVADSGGEKFYVTYSKWFRVARAELPDLAWPQGAALFVPVQIADNSRSVANRVVRSETTRPIAG